MGKACNTVLGLGIAGAIIGMHVYMFLDNGDKREIRDDVKNAVDEMRKIAEKIS